MLAMAVVGMLVYAVAGAAPGDGRDMAPAPCSTDSGSGTTTTTSCPEDDCTGSTTSTTRKDGSTTTTGKDDEPTTSTTDKDDKPTTTTGKGSTTTTGKDEGSGDGDGTSNADDETASAAAAEDDEPTGDEDPCGSTTTTTRKSGCTSSTTAKGDKESTTTTAKDGKCPTTTTTAKSGDKDSTTTTTRKSGDKESTTTTTDRKRAPTTSTTTDGGADPGDDSSGGPGTGLDTPVEPQHIPDDQPSPEPGPSPEPAPAPESWPPPESWEGAGPGEEYDWTFDGSPAGLDGPTGEDVPVGPMAVPGAAPSVLPVFGDLFPGSGGKASAVKRKPSGRVQQLASSPRVTAAIASRVTESSRVSRSLAGLRTSADESAFPAKVIATPKVFPVNRWDPLAAAALVVFAGLARDRLRNWRRRATQVWPL